MNTVNEATGDFVALENNSIDSEWSKDISEVQSNPQSPLLPRSAWQNRQVFSSVLIRAKRALDMVEIAATLWD